MNDLDREKALSIVRKQLTVPRFEHTIRVMDTALQLGELYRVDKMKTELAAIFHDYAKYRDREEMKRWIIKERLPHDLLAYHPELWHGPVGAILVEREVGIHDIDILNAIRWHTTGRQHMSILEKVIFIADYIEPGRDFPGVEEVRQMASNDIDHACWMAARNTIEFLMKRNQSVYPDTFQLYNEKFTGRSLYGE